MGHLVHAITFKPFRELRQVIILPVSLTILTFTRVGTLTLTQDMAHICPGKQIGRDIKCITLEVDPLWRISYHQRI